MHYGSSVSLQISVLYAVLDVLVFSQSPAAHPGNNAPLAARPGNRTSLATTSTKQQHLPSSPPQQQRLTDLPPAVDYPKSKTR